MSKLYDEVLLEHIKNARNYREIEAPDARGEAANPLCGDTFSVFVRYEGEAIADLSFRCECCGISMASASIMTEWLRGKDRREALAIKQQFIAAVAAREPSMGADAHPDHTAVLQLVAATPSRDRCAMLAWTALEAAIGGSGACPDPGASAAY